MIVDHYGWRYDVVERQALQRLSAVPDIVNVVALDKGVATGDAHRITLDVGYLCSQQVKRRTLISPRRGLNATTVAGIAQDTVGDGHLSAISRDTMGAWVGDRLVGILDHCVMDAVVHLSLLEEDATPIGLSISREDDWLCFGTLYKQSSSFHSQCTVLVEM